VVHLIRAEFLKVRTTQVWFWLLLATIALMALAIVAQLAPSDGVRTPGEVAGLLTSAGTADVSVFVLGVLGVTTEFRYQTITPAVLATPSRWALITAKMITYAILGAAYALICVAVELAIVLPWLSAKDIHVSLGEQNIPHALGGVFLVVCLFALVGLGIGALLRNQIVAVTVGLIFILVLENVLLAIPVVKHAFPFTPGGGSASVLAITHNDKTPNGVTLPGAGGGTIVLLLWAFVPAILGAGITMNRDIT
jgi:ABC-2 type transport system permease protein